ncbi:formyltransferase family protein [Niveispirillum cyanobacteriorum]|uniref:formyltransferase family protein n=1 Tax=Niveispirillum cyanobacteriorum TaxID=1612173 RepID=UPI00131A4593|nr:formyltransferase family protein [Niveispirillum cyanobacteriorum]GGE65977.1 hypothetical protein GCM10011317_24080 [Niveispirillum cyanobacteriorum]
MADDRSLAAVVPDHLILATAAALAPSLAPLLPDATIVTSLQQLQTELVRHDGFAIRLASVGFAKRIPASLLAACHAGAVNFHAAPPDYPGSAANHLALYEGAALFGVTAHVMVPALDAGPILAFDAFPIPAGIGHRSLDELTWPALLRLVQRLGPCLRGTAPWPPAPALSWRGTARTRASVLALARVTAAMDAEERQRRWRAFHEGPDSILTFEQDDGDVIYKPGGRIRGWVDGIVNDAIHGWAYDPGRGPVILRVEVDGQPLSDLLANSFRGDVAAAGHGDGHCGFSIPLAAFPKDATLIEFLLPSDEWCRLPGGPAMLIPPGA